ncbi:arsenate reductase family protein [Collinsella sp. zg1085]|uniref:arsenate reductase family protein n=1 Tax=Collinsella sp. zg1085 TaxID=2844380 RepID=UPI001C0E8709|nr:arsenate reductase family protein [Collinsella sp. zg1085]QWT17759.1 arsenate reductase family protein [Collinsella sp. zg1085]
MNKHIVFLEYPKCTTCKRAKKWLDEHGIAYIDRHIVEERPTADELAAWQAASGLAPRRFFNTSGMKYRELGIKAQLDAGMSEADMFALLATDGMLVKRPLVVVDDGEQVLVGFKEDVWATSLL